MAKNSDTMSKITLLSLCCLCCFLPLRSLAQEENNVFQPLIQEEIVLTDVYETPFYELASPRENEALLLAKMVEDIHFTAREMRKQMDDQAIVGGRFDGQTLFNAMEASTEQDLRDFLSYVAFRPQIYRGQPWKISEIYATWMDSETPMPSELLIDWLINTTESVAPASVQADCNGKELYLNLKKGRLNKLKPTASMELVKSNLSCFTGETAEGESFNCGGGVFFLNHQMFFYTHHDYIQVRTGFAGQISEDLLGKTVAQIVAQKGQPDRVPEYEGDNDWGIPVDIVYLYATRYGALELDFDPETKRCTAIAIHQRPVDLVAICW